MHLFKFRPLRQVLAQIKIIYMEDKSKVFVFDRIEVIVIFLFMVVLAVTCFTLGVSIGKKYAIRTAGITEGDEREVILKSQQEEYVDDVIEQNKNDVIEEKVETAPGGKNAQLTDKAINRLSEEFEELEKSPEEVLGAVKKEEVVVAEPEIEQKPAESPLIGKFTIQLGSYQNLEDAKSFADGFTIRGYNPLINEVEISGKGIWYRVSLGIFETVTSAKDYIKKESSLFQGQDYVITDIK